jgi:ABC-type phosphate transport system permease subunit
MFMLGLFMWLNFLTINSMYVYWPVVLVGLTMIILFLPARVLYHRSRKWWAYSNVSDLCIIQRGSADKNSGVFCLLVYILLSFAISSLAICIARKHTLWG